MAKALVNTFARSSRFFVFVVLAFAVIGGLLLQPQPVQTLNPGPVANAGFPQFVSPGATVRLDGSRSLSASGAQLSFQWSFVSLPSGSTAALANANRVIPSFVVDKPGTYVVQLQVNDGAATSSAQVVVSTVATPPTANAGPAQLVTLGSTVQLDGSASSDADGDLLSYQWTFISKPVGSAATLSNSSSITPTFVADVDGAYIVQLAVTDAHSNTRSDTVTISTQSVPPVAKASVNAIATLGGTVLPSAAQSSDALNDALTFSWAFTFKPAGSNATISNPSAVNPSFVPDVAGDYVLQLTATDSHNNNASITTLVTTINDTPPTSVAGNKQTLPLGATVRLDGTNSTDPAGAQLSYRWNIIARPAGSTASILSQNLPTPSFVPDKAGQYVVQLQVSDGAFASAPSTALVNVTSPAISVSPTSITFPSQTINTSSSSVPVTLTNTGNADLVITSILLSGFNSNEFSYTAAARPITVAPGASTTVNMTFSPLGTGLRSANLFINDNAPDSPQTVSLNGTGGSPSSLPAISLSPAGLNFGTVNVGSSSTPTSITISNPSTSQLQITGVSITGVNAGDFTTNAAAPINVSAGASTTVSVTFTPAATGARSASLSFVDNASGSPHSVPLSGTGGTPSAQISLNPTSLNFGSQAQGTTSAAQTITVTNPSATTLQISSLSFGGANPGDFSTTTATPISVAPNGGTATIGVKFTPTQASSRSATLNLSDNASGSPHQVTLSGTGTPPGSPAVSLSTTSLAFGNQTVGTSSNPLPVIVTNTGSGTLTITSLLTSGFNALDFVYSASPRPISVAPGASTTVNMTFAPSQQGPKQATLIINDNSPDSPHMITMTGNGTVGSSGTPAISLNPPSLTFASQTLNTTSAAQLITVTNSGTATLTVSSLSFGGLNAAEFTTTTAAPFDVPANGGSASIAVRFTPTAGGTRTATLNIADNASGSPHTVSLNGTGAQPNSPSISLNPPSLTFASQNVGTTSLPSTITVSNPGTATLQISSLTVSGTNAGDFAVTTVTPISVAAGGSATVSVTFTPAAGGSRSATLNIADNATGSPHTVALSGTGASVNSTPGISLNPTAVNFGSQTQGVASAAQLITVTNTGTATLTVSNLVFTGANPGDFSTTTPTPFSVAANGGTATISVKFTPALTGSRSATLSISDNASGSPHQVTLAGSGTAPAAPVASLSATSLSFGSQGVNSTRSPLPLTITNTGGSTLTITSLLTSGFNATEFFYSASPRPISVAPGASTTVNVTFTPAQTGPRQATLIINDNSADSPHMISMTGSGSNQTPGIGLSPTPLNFGNQNVGTTSAASVVTVTNTGTATLTVSGFSFTGANAADFQVTTATPMNVAANNGTATIAVRFTPGGTGTRSATLNITDNASGSPHTLTVSGNGVDTNVPVFSVNPTSVNFGNQNAGTTSAPQVITVSNTGNSQMTISSLTFSGNNPNDFATSTPAPINIAAGASANISLTFTPAFAAARSAILNIADNAGGPHQLTLSGTGLQATPGIGVSPSPVDFGSQPIGQATPKTVTISNTGTGQLQVTSILTSGLNASDFAYTGVTMPLSIAPGASANLTLTFTPAFSGARTATLILNNNSPNSPQMITLQGSGATLQPIPAFSPASVTFGDTRVGITSAAQTITVTNSGPADLQISSLSLLGANSADFLLGTTVPLTVARNGGTGTILVSFKPGATGTRTASLNVTDNATTSPQVIPLSGNATPALSPGISLNPTSFNFGNQFIGTTSAPTTITVTNPGTADLQITALTFTGNTPNDFATTTAVPLTVPANGGTRTISVTFTPPVGGSRSATLNITDNASGSPHLVSLTGTGAVPQPQSALSVTSVTFPNQTNGTTSSPSPITITNNGNGTLHVSSMLISGSNATDFAYTGVTTPFTVAANGGSVTFNATFTPQFGGQRTANLIINSDAANSPQTVSLNGTGVAPAPAVLLNPTSLNFGDQGVSVTSVPRQVTITNTGTASLQITSFSITNATLAGEFVVTTPAPITVAVNASTTVSVTFRPSATGPRVATLNINDNAGNGTQQVSLTGNGTSPVLSANPTVLSFGSQGVGQASTPQTVTISNTGTGNLVISTISFSGANAADFSSPTPVPVTIAAGSSAPVNVVFTPSIMNNESATLALADNSAGSPHTISLTGQGVQPSFTISPSNVNFGTQTVGVASNPVTIAFSNSGTAPLSISGMTIGGTNSGDFSIPALAFPITIQPNGGSTTVPLTFTPGNLGTRSASITVNDNAPGSPHTILLTGTGVIPQIAISPATFNFGNQTVGVASAPTTITISNPGTATLTINGLSFTGANATDFSTLTNTPITVPANNGSTSVLVVFNPTGAGARTAQLSVSDNAQNSPHTMTLNGTGIAPTPSFSASPANGLTFVSQKVNTTSASQLVTITNTGTADMTISALSMGGTNPGDFATSTTTPITVPKNNGTATISVTFTPTATGSRSATLNITDNAAGSPHSVALSGTGAPGSPTVSFSSTNLSFGVQQVNTTSAAQTITVNNTGDGTLVITGFSFTGTNPSEFAVTTPTPINIAPNASATFSVTFTPTNISTRTATLNVIDNADTTPAITVTGIGTASGHITMPPLSVGANLEALATASLDVAPGSNLTVTIKSSDPTKVLLVPLSSDGTGTTVGTQTITGVVPAGGGVNGFNFPGFWVQSLASSGTAQITVTAPGYIGVAATVTLTPSGFMVGTSAGSGKNFSTPMAVDTPLVITLAQLDSLGNVLTTTQRLRGGISASITITSSSTTTGIILNSPVTISGGALSNNAAAFRPAAPGTTVLSVTQPSGFMAPATATQLTATVTAPNIIVNPITVGFNMQATGIGHLDTPAPPGGLVVTITSSDPTKVLLSTSASVPGSASIALPTIAGGQGTTSLTFPSFFIQALASSGVVTLTASAPGYNTSTSNVALNPSAFLLNSGASGGDFATTTISSPTTLTVSAWQLDPSNRPFLQGSVRAGLSVNVTVTSATPSTGTVNGNPAVMSTANSTNNSLSFQPTSSCQTPCTTLLSVTQPAGYASPTNGASLTATVNQPALTLLSSTTIGKNLEVLLTGSTTAPAPQGGLTVTITSSNPQALLLSSADRNDPNGDPNGTRVGSGSITVTVPAGQGTQSIGFPNFWAQALASSGTVTLTATAPGFTSSTITITLAPSGFVISSGNGIGADFGGVLMFGDIGLTVSAVLLDPATSAPTTISQLVRAGMSATITVATDNPSVGTITNSPITIGAGASSAGVTFHPTGSGQTTVTITTPGGFTTPSGGTQVIGHIT